MNMFQKNLSKTSASATLAFSLFAFATNASAAMAPMDFERLNLVDEFGVPFMINSNDWGFAPTYFESPIGRYAVRSGYQSAALIGSEFVPPAPTNMINGNGTTIFSWSASESSFNKITITEVDHHLFALGAIDVSNLYVDGFAEGMAVELTGHYPDGSIQTDSLEIVENTWTTHLPKLEGGLTELEIWAYDLTAPNYLVSIDPAIDNINLYAVPEPATALMLGAGLLGFSLVRRGENKT